MSGQAPAEKGIAGTGAAAVNLPSLPDARIGIAVAQFNQAVTERLLAGALAVCRRAGIPDENVTILRVPGAFELPLAAQTLAGQGCHGVIALGAVIRGDTPHFDYVCQQAAAGLMRVALDHHIPVGFGVLTTETLRQAFDRAGGPVGNRGEEAAQAVLAMVRQLREIEKR